MALWWIITSAWLFLALSVDSESNGSTPPGTGLYFTLGGRLYLPGSSVNISDIKSQPLVPSDGPEFTLVCVTDNVNRNCCRPQDNNGNGIGNWVYPNNGGNLHRPNRAEEDNESFSRNRFTRQVRLGTIGTPEGPLGEYLCVVPDEKGVNVQASINVINVVAVTSVSITPSLSSVAAGSSVNLNCLAIIVGRGSPSFMWSGPKSRNAMIGQARTESTFTDEFVLGRVQKSDNGVYTCHVSIGSSVKTATATLSISVTTDSNQSTEQNNNIGSIAAATVVLIATVLIIISLAVITPLLAIRQRRNRYSVKILKEKCTPNTKDSVYEEIDRNTVKKAHKVDKNARSTTTAYIETVNCVAYEEMKTVSKFDTTKESEFEDVSVAEYSYI